MGGIMTWSIVPLPLLPCLRTGRSCGPSPVEGLVRRDSWWPRDGLPVLREPGLRPYSVADPVSALNPLVGAVLVLGRASSAVIFLEHALELGNRREPCGPRSIALFEISRRGHAGASLTSSRSIAPYPAVREPSVAPGTLATGWIAGL